MLMFLMVINFICLVVVSVLLFKIDICLESRMIGELETRDQIISHQEKVENLLSQIALSVATTNWNNQTDQWEDVEESVQ